MRSFAALVVLVLAGSAAACDPTVVDSAADDGRFSRSGGSQQTLNVQLAALRRATAPFHNFEKATQQFGYGTQVTTCWYHSGLGGQGYHYGRLDRIMDPTVKLLEPELLMYEPLPGGGYRLVGVEYIVPIDAWPGSAPPVLLGQEFHRNEGLGIYALHVWVWPVNPSGMFADWNPNVSCEHAAESVDRAGAAH
jgi:hypothetical protein